MCLIGGKRLEIKRTNKNESLTGDGEDGTVRDYWTKWNSL